MKRYSFVTTSLFICSTSFAAAPAPTSFTPGGPIAIPAECANLAVMQAQLLSTVFRNNNMGDGTYNPASLTLKTNDGFSIGKTEYLGGDNEDQTGPNAGKYPCDQPNNSICGAIPDAGGAMDWARVTVNNSYGPAAQVVVSMGSRGGCIIDSATNLLK